MKLAISAAANLGRGKILRFFFGFFYLREINIPTFFFFLALGFNQYLNLMFSLLFGF
jgi:hypothetical protein